MTDHQLFIIIAVVAVLFLLNGWHYGFGPFRRTVITTAPGTPYSPLPGILSLALGVVVALFLFNVLSAVIGGGVGLALLLILVILLFR